MNDEVSSPFRETEVRGSVAGRGAEVNVEELRADFASGLHSVLCEGERVERLFAIRSERIAKQTFPATVLVLTDRALLVLREPPKDIGVSLGIRVAIVSYRSLGAIELGHVALRGSFELRFGTPDLGAPLLKKLGPTRWRDSGSVSYS